MKNEVAANKKKAASRVKEIEHVERYKQIRSTRDTLKSAQSSAIMPNLNEFRKLPVVKIYEASGSSSGTSTTNLQDPFVESVLRENLDQWRDAARVSLAAVLGFPGWRNLSKRKLHPVDRLTARFRCKRCDASAAAGPAKKVPAQDDGGMDFAHACEHVCAHLQKKKKTKDRWSADRFSVDQKVILH